MRVPKPQEYVWIEKWGKMLGLAPYHIADEQQRAADDHAPLDALYEEEPGKWRTTDDLGGEERVALGLPPTKETF